MIVAVTLLISLLAYCCFAFAGRMFPRSFIDSFGCGLLLLQAGLIAAMLAAGLSGRLQQATVASLVVAIGMLLLVLRYRLQPADTDTGQAAAANSPIVTLALIGAAGVLVPVLLALVDRVMEVTDLHFDLLAFELPNILTFLRAKTLWIYDGWIMYYPYNYSLLLAWGLMFGHSLGFLYLAQLLAVGGVLLYGALIVRHVLAERSGHARSLAACLAVIGIALLSPEVRLFTMVGKNDTFNGACVLASIYYLMLYWSRSDSRSLELVLVGLALGMAIGTKISGLFWLGCLAAVHVGLCLRHPPKGIGLLPRLARDVALVATPVLLLGGSWILRTYLEFGIDPNPEKWALSRGNSIWNLYSLELLWGDVDRWLPVLVIALIGSVLFLAPIRRGAMPRRIVALALMIYAVHAILMTPLHTPAKLGALVICGVLSVTACIGFWAQRDCVNQRALCVALCSVAGFVMLVFSPYSAWTGGSNYVDPTYVRINYRYNAAGFPLVIVTLVVLCFSVLPSQPRAAVKSSGSERSVPRFGRLRPWMEVAGVVLPLLLCALLYSERFAFPDTFPEHDNRLERKAEPTSVYSWARQNLRGESILVTDLLPLGFYGPHLENRVDYSFHDQPRLLRRLGWDMRELETRIAQLDVGYLAVGLARNRSPIPRESIQPVLTDLGRSFAVAFEDAQAIVFSTPNANRRAAPGAIHYDFDTLAASDLYGEGWQAPKTAPDGTNTRSNRVEDPYLVVRLEASRAMEAQLRVVGPGERLARTRVALRINDTIVQLERAGDGLDGVIFRGPVPHSAWHDANTTQRIDFEITRAEPEGVSPSSDSGPTKIAFDWLKLEPL